MKTVCIKRGVVLIFLIAHNFFIHNMEIESYAFPPLPDELTKSLPSYFKDETYGVLTVIPFCVASKKINNLLKDREQQEEQVALHKLHTYACTEFDDFITQPVYLRNLINPCRPGWCCLLLKACAKCEDNLIEFAWKRAAYFLPQQMPVNISPDSHDTGICAYDPESKLAYSPISYNWFQKHAQLYGYIVSMDDCDNKMNRTNSITIDHNKNLLSVNSI